MKPLPILGIVVLSASAVLIACENATNVHKASISQIDEASKRRYDSLRTAFDSPAPIVATRNVIITEEEDLVGYWVGLMRTHDSLWDDPEFMKKFGHDELAGYVTDKINISIDSLQNNKVYGHSVVAGKSRPFEGNYLFKDNTYVFDAREPGNEKEDGQFRFTIAANDSLVHGEWQAFKTIDIPRMQFELKKMLYTYDPAMELEEYSQLMDESRTRTDSVIYDEENGVKEWYEQEKFASSTEDALKYNASTTLLDKSLVENLKRGDIFIIRNSIFARHGYSFRDKALRQFFNYQSWYIPVHSDVKSLLSDVEMKNIELLMRYEEHAEEYYDYFGR